jgi:hypothetical protein
LVLLWALCAAAVAAMWLDVFTGAEVWPVRDVSVATAVLAGVCVAAGVGGWRSARQRPEGPGACVADPGAASDPADL